jgi:hypothetical protein
VITNVLEETAASIFKVDVNWDVCGLYRDSVEIGSNETRRLPNQNQRKEREPCVGQ